MWVAKYVDDVNDVCPRDTTRRKKLGTPTVVCGENQKGVSVFLCEENSSRGFVVVCVDFCCEILRFRVAWDTNRRITMMFIRTLIATMMLVNVVAFRGVVPRMAR